MKIRSGNRTHFKIRFMGEWEGGNVIYCYWARSALQTGLWNGHPNSCAMVTGGFRRELSGMKVGWTGQEPLQLILLARKCLVKLNLNSNAFLQRQEWLKKYFVPSGSQVPFLPPDCPWHCTNNRCLYSHMLSRCELTEKRSFCKNDIKWVLGNGEK